jgi:2-succinyl-5-enolpyruvyl-6-hydroxy-3-cyclohexene-1-carboxylate synthase
MGRSGNKNAEHAEHIVHVNPVLLRLQPIYDIAEICTRHGVTHAVVCPGSRCAPLTLAFARHPQITCRTFSDERSAGFVALGIAHQTNNPVILVCTSGSAAYNFAPAIAEAFFQQIPLLVFTADRPAEWIDQWDGQTIRQPHLYGAHVKRSYQLPQEYEHPDSVWHIHRAINEAIITATEFPAGPVHINVPLREPLYPSAGETITFSKNVKVIQSTKPDVGLKTGELNSLAAQLNKHSRILLVGGQCDYSVTLLKSVSSFCGRHQIPVVGDIISNLHAIKDIIQHADVFLGQCPEQLKESLKPDLLITFGKSVISKNLKLFLRKYQPKEHWHLQLAGPSPDPFQSLTRVIPVSPDYFFDYFSNIKIIASKPDYCRVWQAEEKKTKRSILKFFRETGFSEFHAVQEVLNALPADCQLHLANSMPVRYANFIGLKASQKKIKIFANRGTSGIDGCSSTAAGHALTSEVPNVLLTGDMAFFYDRNAFWHNYPLPNLHMVVINNHGGVIFNLIDGPSALPEKENYFVTRQQLTAAHLATEFGFEYYCLNSLKNREAILQKFYKPGNKAKILEVVSDQQKAKETFDLFKQTIKKNY